jgi:hypothetical protein
MPWQQVGQKRYFYRYQRAGRTCRRIYIGAAGSPAAELAATAADLRRLEREAGRRERQAEQASLREAEVPLLELSEGSELLARATLMTSGYRRHDRGAWRKRRDPDRSP